jgi:hypothetical protein
MKQITFSVTSKLDDFLASKQTSKQATTVGVGKLEGLIVPRKSCIKPCSSPVMSVINRDHLPEDAFFYILLCTEYISLNYRMCETNTPDADGLRIAWKK